MTGKERVLRRIRHEPVDCLPLMPITMMFAADLAGVRYGDYARDHRVLVRAQLEVARRFGFDHVERNLRSRARDGRPGRRHRMV